MDKKIFLEKFGSKQSVNTSEGLKVSLRGNRKLLPTNEFSDVISAYDQYMDEREACNTIRLTCQINTVCSNVLFNRITEVVKNEGSSALTFLNYGIDNGENTFDNVIFKPNDKDALQDFWSGGTMNYIQRVEDIASSSSDTPLTELQRDMNYEDITQIAGIDNHPTNAIRDTQLSSSASSFVYHCGLDFFNNHLLRSNTFKTICKLPDEINTTFEGYTAFNTIADVMRDVSGTCVIEKIGFPVDSGIPGNMRTNVLHMYTADEIDTYEDTIKKRLIDNKQNGWVGFYNRSKIKSYKNFSDSEVMNIERPLMNYNGGDFVDMYPGHEYYSFVPMFNKHRNRIEKNWNYCVTYPYSSTTAGFDDIIETRNNLNSLKTIYFDENTRADNGSSQIVMYSIAKHGLSSGDYVNIYRTNNDTSTKIIDSAEVEVVDEFIFIVFSSGVQISDTWVEVNSADTSVTVNNVTYTRHPDYKGIFLDPNDPSLYYYVINDKYVNFDPNSQNISYKKVVNDIECEYYVRLFSRVPNFKFASADTSNEYQITLKGEDGLSLIDKYSTYEYEFESNVSRLAFARNIYNDEIGQIVFTDDIDISNLKDNRGRPLTSIYLTIIKNNQGYKEWYGYDYTGGTPWNENEISADTVEFSHCFGKISCGIESSEESRFNGGINSINRISSLGDVFGYDMDDINPDRTYTERGEGNIGIATNEVSYKHDNLFYGDLCYYDYFNAIERSIEPIMHRFNTAQRESKDSASNSYFSKYIYDELKSDDFDTEGRFVLRTETINKCNEKPEGYYYIPHYEIPIKSFGKINYMLPDILDIRSIFDIGGGIKRIHCLQNHYLTNGDKAMIYNVEEQKYYFLNAISHEGTNEKVFYCSVTDEKGEEASSSIPDMLSGEVDDNYTIFKLDNMGIPSYATLLKDGTCRYIWREVLNNGFNSSDDTLEEYPFTNGAFYVNSRIDLYLRRQDPDMIYELYSEDDIEGNRIEIEDTDNYVKNENIEC